MGDQYVGLCWRGKYDDGKPMKSAGSLQYVLKCLVGGRIHIRDGPNCGLILSGTREEIAWASSTAVIFTFLTCDWERIVDGRYVGLIPGRTPIASRVVSPLEKLCKLVTVYLVVSPVPITHRPESSQALANLLTAVESARTSLAAVAGCYPVAESRRHREWIESTKERPM